MIIYNKFFELLIKKGYNVTYIRKNNLLSQSTLTSLRRNLSINTKAINIICNLLECQPNDIMTHIPDAPPNENQHAKAACTEKSDTVTPHTD